MQIPVIAQTTALLIMSNVFMTIAWYGHLKSLSDKPWWIAAVISWAIALFEYLLRCLRTGSVTLSTVWRS
jgi:uncharacterized protein (DUF486 family)